MKKCGIAYINWNTIPAYRFYKEVYDFKFDVTEGQDVRKKSKNTADYF
ncbi:hypothetical protein [Pontibacter brevis]